VSVHLGNHARQTTEHDAAIAAVIGRDVVALANVIAQVGEKTETEYRESDAHDNGAATQPVSEPTVVERIGHVINKDRKRAGNRRDGEQPQPCSSTAVACCGVTPLVNSAKVWPPRGTCRDLSDETGNAGEHGQVGAKDGAEGQARRAVTVAATVAAATETALPSPSQRHFSIFAPY